MKNLTAYPLLYAMLYLTQSSSTPYLPDLSIMENATSQSSEFPTTTNSAILLPESSPNKMRYNKLIVSDRQPAPHTTFDPQHQLLREYSIPVTQYNGFHYIPFIHGIQLEYDPLDLMFMAECNAPRLLQQALDEVQAFFDEILPYSETVEGFISPLDALFYKGNLSTATVSISTMIDKHRGIILKKFPKLKPMFKQLEQNNNTTITSNRTKRIAPLLVAGIISLVASTGWAVYQQIQLQGITKNIDVLQQNTNRLASQFNKLVDAQRDLEDRTSGIYLSVSDIHEKLESLITTYNCDRADELGPKRIIADWKYSATNSFMRGLDMALHGMLTPDLMPFSIMRKILQHSLELRDTIYQMSPQSVYQLTKVQVVAILNNPVRISGVLMIPMIGNAIIGQKVSLSQCPLTLDQYRYQYPLEGDYIESSDKLTWWKYPTSSCQENNQVAICDKKGLSKNYDDCITNLFVHSDSSICSISHHLDPHERTHVKPTEYGLLVCNHDSSKEITIFKADTLGTMRVVKRKLYPNPVYFNFTEGSQLMIDGRLFEMPRSEEIWDIPTYHIKSHFPTNMTFLKTLQQMKEKTMVSLPPHIELIPTHRVQIHSLGVIIGIIILIIIVLIIVIVVLYKKWWKSVAEVYRGITENHSNQETSSTVSYKDNRICRDQNKC